MAFAVFKNGVQVSKAHKHREVALIELLERRVVYIGSSDFIGDGMRGIIIVEQGYEVRQVNYGNQEWSAPIRVKPVR